MANVSLPKECKSYRELHISRDMVLEFHDGSSARASIPPPREKL